MSALQTLLIAKKLGKKIKRPKQKTRHKNGMPVFPRFMKLVEAELKKSKRKKKTRRKSRSKKA